MAEQLADRHRCHVGVVRGEPEVLGDQRTDRLVELEHAGLDELHRDDRGHRLGDAGDPEPVGRLDRLTGAGDPLAERGARRMVDLVHEAAHDVVEERGLFGAKIDRAGGEQISNAPQDIGTGRNVSLRNCDLKFVDERLMRGHNGGTAAVALATLHGVGGCDIMRHFRFQGC